jgi:hypothetical protein
MRPDDDDGKVDGRIKHPGRKRIGADVYDHSHQKWDFLPSIEVCGRYLLDERSRIKFLFF